MAKEYPDYFKKIEALLIDILESGQLYTPASAAEEFHQEYPHEFSAFKEQYSKEYRFSGCGYRRSHINGFAIILEHLRAMNIVEKINEGAVSYRKRC